MQSYRLMLEHHEEAMKSYSNAKSLLDPSLSMRGDGYGGKADVYGKGGGGRSVTDGTAYKASTDKCILLNADPKEKGKKGRPLYDFVSCWVAV